MQFVLFLVFMMDFLPPLKVASLNFQDEDMFLPTVSRKLEQLKHSMLSLKNGNGAHMRSFTNECTNDN